MAPVVRSQGLTKIYRGGHVGVLELDLEVSPGLVFGLLGPNGAGKTTTLRLLLDLIRPTRGHLEVLGAEVRGGGATLRRELGYLPGDLTLYPDLTGDETIRYVMRLRRTDDRRYADELAKRLDLDLSRHVHDLSKGNRQKLGLVTALMHRPRLAVLDEPTSGLDPVVQQEFAELLREVVAGGATVLLSSHVMSEVEHLADRVAILRAGQVAVVQDVAELRARARRHLDLTFAAAVPAELFTGLPDVRHVQVTGPRVSVEVTGPVGPLMALAAAHGLLDVTTHEPDLERVFLDYMEGVASGAA